MAKVEADTGFNKSRVLNGKTVTYVGVTSNVGLVSNITDLPCIHEHRVKFQKFATKEAYKDLKFNDAAVKKHIGIVCIYCWGPLGHLFEYTFQRVIEHQGGLVCHDFQMIGGKANSELHLLVWTMQTCISLNVIPARVYQVICKLGKVDANVKIKFSSYSVGLLETPVII